MLLPPGMTQTPGNTLNNNSIDDSLLGINKMPLLSIAWNRLIQPKTSSSLSSSFSNSLLLVKQRRNRDINVFRCQSQSSLQSSSLSRHKRRHSEWNVLPTNETHLEISNNITLFRPSLFHRQTSLHPIHVYVVVILLLLLMD